MKKPNTANNLLFEIHELEVNVSLHELLDRLHDMLKAYVNHVDDDDYDLQNMPAEERLKRVKDWIVSKVEMHYHLIKFLTNVIRISDEATSEASELRRLLEQAANKEINEDKARLYYKKAINLINKNTIVWDDIPDFIFEWEGMIARAAQRFPDLGLPEKTPNKRRVEDLVKAWNAKDRGDQKEWDRLWQKRCEEMRIEDEQKEMAELELI